MACDLSIEKLQTLRYKDITAFYTFFEALLPYIQEETKLWAFFHQHPNLSALLKWIETCFKNRKGHLNLQILPFEIADNNNIVNFLSSQKWVRGIKITESELTKNYIYLINYLAEMVNIICKHNTPSSIWLIATITLGPVPKYEYDHNEPMNIAIRHAISKGITVIVAAGNWAKFYKGNSLNPWSLEPDVISVGATNEKGTRLLSSSSRGVPLQSYNAPSVVAPGELILFSGLNHGHLVSLTQLKNAPPGTVEQVPFGEYVLNYYVDESGQIDVELITDNSKSQRVPFEILENQLEGFKQNKFAGTSYAAEYVTAICNRIIRKIHSHAGDLPVSYRPKLLKNILLDMAKPMVGYQPWEAGKGVVTQEIAENYLNVLQDTKIANIIEHVKVKN